MNNQNAKIGVVTVSDRASAGVYEDLGGPAIKEFLTTHLTNEWVAVSRVVPDEVAAVSGALIELADTENCCLIVTTGGTGPALRDPIKRAYSSWENRVFLHAPGTPQSILDMCSDVIVDGRVDVAATFKKFARAIHTDRVTFAIDDHFRPQFNTLYANQLEYHHRIYSDRPGEMQKLADVINERAGTSVKLQRLNSGLGIKADQIFDKETADLIADTYHEDYEWFGFERHNFTAPSTSLVLNPIQQALLNNLRETTERLTILSRAAFNRVGFRYGLSQIRKSLWIRITNPKGKGDTRLLQW
jgi:hypothetical protein